MIDRDGAMKDDELMEAIRQASREMKREDDARAHADAEDAAGWDALEQPLDEVARARMHARALAAMGIEAPVVKGRARAGTAVKRMWFALPLIAAAASIAFFVSRGPGAGADMPAYALAVSNEDVQGRGAGPAPAEADRTAVVSGDRLVLVARPATPVTGAAARVFAVREGRAQEIAPRLTVSSEGAVRIEGSVRALFAPPEGAWEIVVVLGHAGAEAPATAEAVAPSFARAGWTRVRRQVVLRAAP
jgi:hypothetical protein